jgi:hypothetical protein
VFSILVHNQCSDFELVSPVYFGHNSIWIKSPSQKVDINAATEASLGRDTTKDEFASALLYKLQRKKRFESNDQSNTDSTSTKDTSTSLQLLVIWRSTDKSKVSLRALLIKHSNVFTWSKDTLVKLHSMHLSLLSDDCVVRDTWLLDNVTVLSTMLRLKEVKHIIEIIIISEGAREDDSKEPLWVPSSI